MSQYLIASFAAEEACFHSPSTAATSRKVQLTVGYEGNTCRAVPSTWGGDDHN